MRGATESIARARATWGKACPCVCAHANSVERSSCQRDRHPSQMRESDERQASCESDERQASLTVTLPLPSRARHGRQFARGSDTNQRRRRHLKGAGAGGGAGGTSGPAGPDPAGVVTGTGSAAAAAAAAGRRRGSPPAAVRSAGRRRRWARRLRRRRGRRRCAARRCGGGAGCASRTRRQ